MSAKKKNPKNKKGKEKKPLAPLPLPLPPLPPPPDPRAMEKTMADLGRLLGEQEFDSLESMNDFLNDVTAQGDLPRAGTKLSRLEKAQEIMYEAFDTGGKKAVKLALKALETSLDCADAYVLLAEESCSSPEEAFHWYALGVAAGERALGPRTFEQDAGHFWGMLETRPYMRARLGLAFCMRELDMTMAAIFHLQDMLFLNPGDNQGVRYLLASLLLEEGDDKAVARLLKEYRDDPAAAWAYSEALAMFRKHGAGLRANTLLVEAIERNSFVPAYLTGRKKLPSRLPDYVGFGDKDEAVSYVTDAIIAWGKTPGALEWLAETAGKKVGKNGSKSK